MTGFADSVLQWFGIGGEEPPKDPQRSWAIKPPVEEFPSDEDVYYERWYQPTFGNQNFKDNKTGDPVSTANLRQVNEGMRTGFDPAPPMQPMDRDTSMTLTKTGMAAGKSPLAEPDVSRTTISPSSTGMTGVTGAHIPSKDRMWANMSDPPALLHESIHRGLNQLAKSDPKMGALIKKYDGEILTRALMLRHYGDIEITDDGPEEAGNRQVNKAKQMMKDPKYEQMLQEIERAAHYKQAQKLIDSGQGPSLGFKRGGRVTPKGRRIIATAQRRDRRA